VSVVVSHIPLKQAQLCLDCDAVFPLLPTPLGGTTPCPACGGGHAIPLERYVLPRRVARVPILRLRPPGV
jgi:hypothetical protein